MARLAASGGGTDWEAVEEAEPRLDDASVDMLTAMHPPGFAVKSAFETYRPRASYHGRA